MPHMNTSIAIKQAINYQSQFKWDDLQPVYQNREWLLISLGKQYGVTLSTKVYFFRRLELGL